MFFFARACCQMSFYVDASDGELAERLSVVVDKLEEAQYASYEAKDRLKYHVREATDLLRVAEEYDECVATLMNDAREIADVMHSRYSQN